MLRYRNVRAPRTKALTWWADDKPQVESLLRNLLTRKRIQPEALFKKRSKRPTFFATISFYDHGHAEDFHFGQIDRDGSLRYELDLTRIEAHGRKQRLNCALEESKPISLEELARAERLVFLKEQEYRTLRDTVLKKLH